MPHPATPPLRPRPREAPPPGTFRSTDRSLRGPGGWLWGARVLCRRRCAGRRAGVGVGGPRRPSGVRPAGRGRQAAMAEAAPQHLALPSGLLELCALLGPSRDSLRGLEQVGSVGKRRRGAAGRRLRSERGSGPGIPGVCGVGAVLGALARPPLYRSPPGAGTVAVLAAEESRGSADWGAPAGEERGLGGRPSRSPPSAARSSGSTPGQGEGG